MNLRKSFIFLFAFLILSCSSGGGSGDSGSTALTIRGLVVDENNNPIAGADVFFGAQFTTTSSLGAFSISGESTENREFITIKSANKFDAYRGFTKTGMSEVALTIMLMDKGTAQIFNASNSTTIQNSGGSVTLPANAIKDDNGNIYSGQVHAAVRVVNTNQVNFNQLMQGGDFAGVNASQQNGQLRSYGFFAAELEDPSGNKLNLRDGYNAQFTIPLAANDQSSSPSTVKLWYFDTTKGMWMESGTATKVGNNYVGSVPHFSEWNCDDWTSSENLSGSWIAVPSGSCNGSTDIVLSNPDGSFIIIYNMPAASSGTFYFSDACEAVAGCELFGVRSIGDGSIYGSVTSGASSSVTKTGPFSFFYSCTIIKDCIGPSVMGVTGSGTY